VLTLDDLTVEERMALAYCAPRGIPLSVFLGRIVGAGEPQWTERDAQAAVLWQIEQNAHCTGCGRPRSECMVAEIDAPDYEVTVQKCWACEARDAKMLEHQEGKGSTAGVYFSVRPADG
jgi:hypothetical protein